MKPRKLNAFLIWLIVTAVLLTFIAIPLACWRIDPWAGCAAGVLEVIIISWLVFVIRVLIKSNDKDYR